MMRSLFSGVAGLRTHQTRMDVIGNNIANVNTVAYKSSSVTFQDLLYHALCDKIAFIRVYFSSKGRDYEC